MQHVQNGSREALELLIKRHEGWIYNIVIRMIYLPQDAEDATQEILITLMTKLSTFEGRNMAVPHRREPRPQHEANTSGAVRMDLQ